MKCSPAIQWHVVQGGALHYAPPAAEQHTALAENPHPLILAA